MFPNRPNLRHLTRHAHHPGRHLRLRQQSYIHHPLTLQRPNPHNQPRQQPHRRNPPPLKPQNQQTNNDILRRNHRRLAIRTKRETLARTIHERREKGRRLQQVREEGNALCGLRGEEFEDLGQFDDGGAGDGGDAEGFGEEEREAGG